MNKNCVYYCEGEDDQKLVDVLKVNPERILPDAGVLEPKNKHY